MQFEYKTERLILKIVRPEAAEQVLDFYLRDKELFERYEPERIPGFYTVEKLRQLTALEYNAAIKGNIFRFYIYRKGHAEQIIGTICFHDIQKGASRCEIGYKFSSEYHHKGYATEALCAITQAIFRELGLHRIMAWALPDNVASARLLARVGFTYEGISRDFLFIQGRWRDHAQFSMINPDYRAKASGGVHSSSGHSQ
ncbi:MAG: GNAT family N-acetyltransferase [Blautia sp.]|nr:GNAT family N-acetyltransferase [Blautia sp.]